MPSSSGASSPRVDAGKIGCDIINMGGEGTGGTVGGPLPIHVAIFVAPGDDGTTGLAGTNFQVVQCNIPKDWNALV